MIALWGLIVLLGLGLGLGGRLQALRGFLQHLLASASGLGPWSCRADHIVGSDMI